MMESAFSFYTGLAAYLGLCATIYKVCEKGDTLITDDTKLAIAVWILDLKPGKAVQNWPGTFTHWFDKIFGEKHLNWKCFFRSSIASVFSAILVTLIWIALRPGEASFVWENESLFSNFIIYLPLSVFLLNLIPDYISLLETRYILGKMAQTDSGLKHALLLALDALLTLAISVVMPVLILSLFWGDVLKFIENLSLWVPNSFDPLAYIKEVIPLTGTSIVFNAKGLPFLSICFYTTFFTSAWIWGYAVSGLLLKLLTFWEIIKGKIKLEEKPLSAIGGTAILIVTMLTCISFALPAVENHSYSDLRSKPLILNEEQVTKMISERGFFEVEFNIRGKGIRNDYKPEGEVVYDKATNLYWQKGGSDWMVFESAESYIDSLNRAKFGGYDDWRLPTLEEAMSLMEPNKNEYGLYINPIFDSAQRWIWTADRASASSAWIVDFVTGGSGLFAIGYVSVIRAVRSGA